MNFDQVKGRIEEVKGAVKSVAGRLIGSRQWEREGRTQNTSGKVQAAYGDLREDIRRAIAEL
jgi:uncharacterized protein YjbJ (UPF0337 family)